MARRDIIVVDSEPKGRFDEGTIVGALLPGTWLQQDPGVDLDANGRATYEVYTPGANAAGPACILLEDKYQGKDMLTAYADGDHCFVYYPANGDELNALTTVGANPVGTVMTPTSGTGVMTASGSVDDQVKAQLLEDGSTEGPGNVLKHVRYAG